MMKRSLHFPGAVILLLIALGCLQAMDRAGQTPLVRPLDDIPLRLGAWSGISMTFDAGTLENAGVDQYIMRAYADDDCLPVSVYIGFYSRQGVGRTIHSPRRCYTGSGWEVASCERRLIPLVRAPGGEIPVNRLLLRKDDRMQVVYYWFQSRGKAITSEYREKLHLVLDTIVLGRNDGALVRISTDAALSVSEAEERLQAFAGCLYPHMMQCLP